MLQVEAWTLFIALEIATHIKIKKVEVEMNNQELFHLMINEDNLFTLFLLLNCRHLLSKLEAYKVCKIKREQNTCADCLAKEARMASLLLRTYARPPLFVPQVYMADLDAN